MYKYGVGCCLFFVTAGTARPLYTYISLQYHALFLPIYQLLRFGTGWGQSISLLMKILFKTALILSVIALAGCSKSENGHDINSATPFTTNTLFHDCVLKYSKSFDLNKDGIINDYEASLITDFEVKANDNVTSLEGINSLTNLRAFSLFKRLTTPINIDIDSMRTVRIRPGVTTVRISGKKVDFVETSGDITSLDVTGCPNMTKLDVISENLKTLDISKNKKLNYIYITNWDKSVLETLYVWKGFNPDNMDKLYLKTGVIVKK